jgi:diguanylate cyclase (GGDEF)-like protein
MKRWTTGEAAAASNGSVIHFRPRRASAIAGLAVSMAMIFALDWQTSLPHVQHLYYSPIIFAATTFGMTGGVVTAMFAVLLYHLANPQTLVMRYEELDILQIAVFIAVGMATAKLANDARRLHRLAMTDDLTGLHNLRSFELGARALLQRARGTRTSLAFLVLDVDRLKSINDRYGHLAGADAVRRVGQIIAAHAPPDAVACRYGGDEFVIGLLGRSRADAERLADALRVEVEACAPVLADVPFARGSLSISIGMAWRFYDRPPADPAVHDEDEQIEALFRAADAALYAAKNGGRNRLHLA